MTVIAIKKNHSLWALLFSLCFILIAFSGAEKELYKAWQTEEYSHGFFIPVIAVLLCGHFLEKRRPILYSSAWGIVFLLSAAFLLLVTHLSAFAMTAEYGLVIAIIGLSLIFLGLKATWVMAPALFYLIFCIPLPHLLQAGLSQGLQLLSSSIGVWILDLVDIPVYQEGNIIDLGGYRLQVVEACSGLRYLFPLMSFGYLVALMLEDKYWKKLFIFLSTIPISVCLNALRIAIIGLTVDIWGQQMAEGFIHSFEGWVIFAACLLLLGLETWILMHIGKAHGKFRYDYFSLPRNFSFQHFSIQPNLALTTLFITFLLALFFGTDLLDAIPEKPPIHKDFNSFPTTFGNWKGHQERLSPEVLDALQLNDYWLADYKNQTTSSFINLYIAYYASQKVGVTTHSPSNCIPGGGWVISESRISSVQLDDGTQVKITRLLIKKDQTTQLVYYWFDERGRDLVETTYAKWYLMWDSIFMHRSDGALIRLVTPVQDQEGHEADVRLQEFLRKIYPTIKLFVPGKEAGKDSPKSPQGSLEDVSP